MIANVLMVHLRRLMHNRTELMLTFVVPVAFFSIFALIFAGGVGGGTTPKIKVVVVDENGTPQSAELAQRLAQNDSLRIMRDESPRDISRDDASTWVRSGSLTMAIVLAADSEDLAVELLADSSDQVASQVVTAIVSQCLGKMRMESMQLSAAAIDPATPDRSPPTNRLAMRTGLGGTPRGVLGETAAIPDPSGASIRPRSLISVVDVLGEGKSNPVISMYAAGIAVMFLLFGASGGGGTLLEEKENQTLDRLLSTRMTMDQLILGKWIYLTLLGIVQVTTMFAWAQLVFGVDFLGHFDGFLMMTVVTSSAAASLGLFLATLCKTRGQLNGLSVILILTMSALGGSMVPRYIMSEPLREAGLWTFNAWALDGYDKVFWRELPVESLAPQMTVLMLSGVALLVAARLLAVRWESQ